MSFLLANPFGDLQWLVVALVVLLLFGNRLPTMMRSIGEGVSEFKKGINGIEEKDAATEPPPKLGDPSVG